MTSNLSHGLKDMTNTVSTSRNRKRKRVVDKDMTQKTMLREDLNSIYKHFHKCINLEKKSIPSNKKKLSTSTIDYLLTLRAQFLCFIHDMFMSNGFEDMPQDTSQIFAYHDKLLLEKETLKKCIMDKYTLIQSLAPKYRRTRKTALSKMSLNELQSTCHDLESRHMELLDTKMNLLLKSGYTPEELGPMTPMMLAKCRPKPKTYLEKRKTTWQYESIRDLTPIWLTQANMVQPEYTRADDDAKKRIFNFKSHKECVVSKVFGCQTHEKSDQGDHIFEIAGYYRFTGYVGVHSKWATLPCSHKWNVKYKKVKFPCSDGTTYEKHLGFNTLSDYELILCSVAQRKMYMMLQKWFAHCEARGAILKYKPNEAQRQQLDKMIQVFHKATQECKNICMQPVAAKNNNCSL